MTFRVSSRPNQPDGQLQSVSTVRVHRPADARVVLDHTPRRMARIALPQSSGKTSSSDILLNSRSFPISPVALDSSAVAVMIASGVFRRYPARRRAARSAMDTESSTQERFETALASSP